MTNSAEAATVTVVNQSGQTIVACYYRPTNSSQWYYHDLEENIYNGNTHYLHINVDYRYIDLSFRLADGTYQERTGIDLYNDFTLYVGG